jgi:pyruvate-formate lyase-activating enzyme
MTPWQEFYTAIQDPTWPDCLSEKNFDDLPDQIKKEIIEVHGYRPGEYQQQSQLIQKSFAIVTDTACQLKWNWSTIYLTTAKTASCHRTNHHAFDTEIFDFHNTPEKLDDRRQMLQGKWPKRGCEYCQNIESAGGTSDRITNLNMPGMHAPIEMDLDPTAISVTPRILEVYFDNLCNLKCLYCGPYFSSLWDAENKRFGNFNKNGLTISANFAKNPNFANNKEKLFKWLRHHRHGLTNFNILGGEPLFQKEFDECLDFFEQHPAPDLDVQIFTNLNASESKIDSTIGKVRKLIDGKCIRHFTVTASLDCWGPEAEFARFPLDLRVWERNFERLLTEPWIRLVIGSTVTPLTVKTLPDLIARINQWRQQRTVHHYFNSVNAPSYLFIDMFGDIFRYDFERALDIMPEATEEQKNTKNYLAGIALQSVSGQPNISEIRKLRTFLDEMDRRRQTDWRAIHSWLTPVFDNVLGPVDQ